MHKVHRKTRNDIPSAPKAIQVQKRKPNRVTNNIHSVVLTMEILKVIAIYSVSMKELNVSYEGKRDVTILSCLLSIANIWMVGDRYHHPEYVRVLKKSATYYQIIYAIGISCLLNTFGDLDEAFRYFAVREFFLHKK